MVTLQGHWTKEQILCKQRDGAFWVSLFKLSYWVWKKNGTREPVYVCVLGGHLVGLLTRTVSFFFWDFAVLCEKILQIINTRK